MKKNTFLPSYTVGEEAYKEVKNICEKYGRKVVFIGGKIALEKASNLVRKELENSNFEILDELWFGGEASYENAEKLKANKAVQEADMVFAFGGGKCCDTCKVVTGDLKKPLFTFPTIAATCASITKVAAIYFPNGTFKEVYFKETPPEHVFINTKIIAEAPVKYLWAGIGDTLAKGYEPEFCSRNKEISFSDNFGVTMSKLCKESLIQYGEKALKDCEKNLVSVELEKTILTIIVTTGIVSNYLEMCYNSGVAHAVCYGFSTVKSVEEKHLHGELVSYGVLVLLAMDNKYEEIKKLLPLYRNINLPTTYKKFNLELNEMDGVFDKASSVKDIEVSAYEVTREMIYKAVLDLEKYVSEN